MMVVDLALQGELSATQERDHLGGNADTPVAKAKVGYNPAKPNAQWNAKNPEISSSSSPFKLYNIGNNAPLPLMTFIETIENALGKKAEKNFMPMQDGDVVSTYADVSGLMEDFGYKPDTDLKDGIKEFVKWYREFYKENK